eukprot:TRINITY_DN3232_c1_g2_i1.p1 TRINITY_DN3232_c1_g2~~TRINITY_DN3232_c1_g2_i1.p1  ORF type:complete len:186 (-),score=18.96 TRINITY_DN3232_c1_g2_i1:149-706(-)
MAVPVAYAASLLSFVVRCPLANAPEFSLVVLQMLLSAKACSVVGRGGALYWWLSSCFSMGLLCHPLAGFWILQHLCIGGAQPTVSYRGSSVWNWLTMNELLHVEHHDLAKLSWRHTQKLRDIAPELYDGLHSETSVCSLLKSWLRNEVTGAGEHGLDFGCRHVWGCVAGPDDSDYEYESDATQDL